MKIAILVFYMVIRTAFREVAVIQPKLQTGSIFRNELNWQFL